MTASEPGPTSPPSTLWTIPLDDLVVGDDALDELSRRLRLHVLRTGTPTQTFAVRALEQTDAGVALLRLRRNADGGRAWLEAASTLGPEPAFLKERNRAFGILQSFQPVDALSARGADRDNEILVSVGDHPPTSGLGLASETLLVAIWRRRTWESLELEYDFVEDFIRQLSDAERRLNGIVDQVELTSDDFESLSEQVAANNYDLLPAYLIGSTVRSLRRYGPAQYDGLRPAQFRQDLDEVLAWHRQAQAYERFPVKGAKRRLRCFLTGLALLERGLSLEDPAAQAVGATLLRYGSTPQPW